MSKNLEHRNKARLGERLFRTAPIDLLNLLSWEDYKKQPIGIERIWEITNIFKEDYAKSICQISGNNYTLYMLVQMRYIATFSLKKKEIEITVNNKNEDTAIEDIVDNEDNDNDDVDDDEYEEDDDDDNNDDKEDKEDRYECVYEDLKNFKEMSFSEIVTFVNERASISFKAFEKNQKRRLFAMLNCLLGQNVFQQTFKSELDSYEFNAIDCQFFSFLLNTYDSVPAKKLRNQNYADVEEAYLYALKCGISNLKRAHESMAFIEPEKIYQRLKYSRRSEAIELQEKINELKNTANNIISVARYDLWEQERVNKAIHTLKSLNHDLESLLN